MQAPTKKHPTEGKLVPLHFLVHPANVERIRRYVSSVEPDEQNEGSITAEEFFSKHFGARPEWAVILHGARIREGLTQVQLAQLTGIPQRHISEMENGKRAIGKERARALAKVLNADYR
ncbi:MAG: helix-turn-helix transcriptional regulator, partial [Pseudomonadota bacterium]